jgi:hypothetical protein
MHSKTTLAKCDKERRHSPPINFPPLRSLTKWPKIIAFLVLPKKVWSLSPNDTLAPQDQVRIREFIAWRNNPGSSLAWLELSSRSAVLMASMNIFALPIRPKICESRR